VRTIAFAGILLATLGCGAENSTEPDLSNQRPVMASSAAPGCTASLGHFCKYYGAGDVISLVATPGVPAAVMSAVSGAAGEWSNVGVLDFTTGGGGDHQIEIRYNSSPTGTGWCGHTDLGGDGVPPAYIEFERGACGPLSQVALHELSHVAGYQGSGWHRPEKVSPALYDSLKAGHCAFHLRTTFPTVHADQLCQHEIEGVKYVYGARSVKPNFYEHIATSIGAPASPAPIDVGASASVGPASYRYARASGTLCGLSNEQACGDPASVPTTSSAITWTSTNPAIATVVRTSQGATVTGVAEGSTSINLNTALSSTRATSFGAGTMPVNVADLIIPPAGPPVGIGASSIGPSSALITWTNGDAAAGTTTFIEYQPAGAGTWSPGNGGNGLPAGQSSYTLGSLANNTTYSVRLYHRKDNVNSAVTTATSLFTTLSAPPVPVIHSFSVTGCEQSLYGGKWYNNWWVSWTSEEVSPAVSYQVGSATSNNPAASSVVASGKATLGSTTVGPYLASGSSNRYFWIRYTQLGAIGPWVPLDANPLNVAGECAL
jgi:hypothetical protein